MCSLLRSAGFHESGEGKLFRERDGFVCRDGPFRRPPISTPCPAVFAELPELEVRGRRKNPLKAEKKWRCLTCGFAWSKDEPPDACPVCGAPKSQFSPIGRGKIRFLRDVVESSRVHPIAVHFPNGALPACLLFLYLFLLTGVRDFERAAFFLLIVVVVAIPVSLASGFRDWKRNYAGRKVPVFYRKIGLASGLLTLGVAGALLRGLGPGLFGPDGPLEWVYVLVLTAMLFLVVLLGHWGGKLVFEWRKFPKAAGAEKEEKEG